MAEPKVSLLLMLIDKMSAPIQGVRGQLKAWGNDFKDLGRQAGELLNNKLIQGIGLIGIQQGLQKAFEAADRFAAAAQKLDGTAKITGVSLDFLQGIADDAAKKFGLSKVQAADFAVEMAKLASKAGDVGKAAPALQAFLDIGAARGLTAEQTLKAVQQAILGIDEGTDKLFNANPSVLYDMFAASIGTTAGKLTDQQKAQALLNAAMEDGSKVQAAYSEWLQSVAGQAQMARNRSEEAYAALGTALGGFRIALAGVVEWVAGKLSETVTAAQMLGNNLGAFFLMIPERLKLLWGSLLKGMGEAIEGNRILMTIFGDGFQEMAENAANSGTRMVREATRSLGVLKAAHSEARLDILGIETTGQLRQTAALQTGLTNRTTATRTGNAAREAEEKKAQDALKKLREAAAKAVLESMSALGRALYELQEQVNAARLSSDRATHEEAERLYRNGVSRILGEYAKIEPRMAEVNLAVRTELANVGVALDTQGKRVEGSVERWERLKSEIGETATSIGKGAEEILRLGRDIGAVNPQLEQLIGGIGRLAEGIGGIAKATTAGGLFGAMASAVLGLQGIVGSLFGNSPAEQARKELLRKNTVALDRLRDQVGDLMASQSSGATIAKFKGLDFSLLAGGGDSKADRIGRLASLGQMLRSKGLTVGDFETMLADLGIDAGDWRKEGFSSGVMQQIVQGLKDWEPHQFDQSFGGQQDFLQRYFGVAGIDDPALQAEFAKTNLKGKSDWLANLIGGFDLNTAEGRSGLQEAFAQVFQQLNNGTFNAANFGQLTGSEFVEFIEYFSDLIKQMGGSGTGTGSATYGTMQETTSVPAPVTIAAESATVLSEIALNTGLTVEELKGIRAVLEAGALGTTNIYNGGPGGVAGDPILADRLSEILASAIDLTTANGGAA